MINKLYFQALQSFGEIDIEDEDYIKDYINYTISIHPNNSKINLFVTLLEKLLFLQRYPKDIKEFLASDFNTDNINSKLEKINLNQVSKLKKVFMKISENLKNKNAFKRANYISYDEEVEFLCNNFEEIIKPYRVETQSTEKNQLGE